MSHGRGSAPRRPSSTEAAPALDATPGDGPYATRGRRSREVHMPRHVLGINWYAHDASAALLRDGRIAFAAAEERFSRIKKDNRFPELAIGAALKHADIGIADLDGIAFGWN